MKTVNRPGPSAECWHLVGGQDSSYFKLLGIRESPEKMGGIRWIPWGVLESRIEEPLMAKIVWLPQCLEHIS